MPRPSLIGASVLLCALHLAWPAAQAQSQTRGAPATLAPVERFEVVGNTLLPQATIDTRLAAFKGATTLVRLREAAAAVQDLYRDAGYGGVIAFLPEQQAAPGQIRIRVVEGKLSLVEVADNRQFSAENIRASLPSLVTGVTPRVRQIDAEIQMANESPAKEVKVLLEPGQAPGSVAARVMVLEQPVQRWTARLDNTGVGNTGQWRSALGWQHGNLFGRDHVLGTEVQTAPANPSRLAVFSAAYRVPLYAQASALDAYAAWSDVDGGRSSTAAGDLLFSGKGRIAGLRATRYLPRVGNVDQRASLGVEQREFINQCSIEGLPPGACGPAGASVTVRPLALGYTAQAEGDTRFGLNVSAHANLQAGGSHAGAADFTAVRQGSRPDYRVLRANGFVARSLSDWGVLGLRMSGQTTDQPLVPGEQFGIGGSLSVRGYLEREVLGDTGLQASLELSSTNLSPRISEALSRTELVVVGFADAAMVRNQQSDPCLIGRSSCTLAGAGVGLRATWSAGDQILRFRLDLAQALKDAYRTRSGDWRLHGSLSITF
jgi:hemolysin activation/secretion protein